MIFALPLRAYLGGAPDVSDPLHHCTFEPGNDRLVL
jgi:hypothetical protein